MRCFIPRQWRLQYVLYALILIEFPFTVANLALFGIASPNLYRSILRSEGAKMGFNSDGLTELYAAANYRPVKTPVVWSNLYVDLFLTIRSGSGERTVADEREDGWDCRLWNSC